MGHNLQWLSSLTWYLQLKSLACTWNHRPPESRCGDLSVDEADARDFEVKEVRSEVL